MEGGHEEALGQVVQVVPHGQHVVALSPGTAVETAALHARAEAADGGTLRQRQGLLKDAWRGRG